MSSYQVQPEENPPAFNKPLKLKTPLTHWDAAYLTRKTELGEKLFTCKSGREFCYFTDGTADPSQAGVPVVLCLHGALQNKYSWIMVDPPAGIFIIVPDRMGSVGGSSSTPKEGYSFEDGCKEFLELMDGVYADRKIPMDKKFFVAGHSMGGTWALSMAACPEVCDRIEAIAPISAPGDPHRMTKQERKKLMELPGFIIGLNKKGCCGAFNRFLFWKFFYHVAGNGNAGRTGDYGFAAKYEQLKNHTGGDDRGKNVMDANPFFVCAALDSLRGFNQPHDSFNEWARCNAAEWSYDTAVIKVPCFIYTGEKETAEMVNAEFHQRQVKGSELIAMQGHGHLSISLEYPSILEALVNKKKWEGSCIPE